MAKHAKKQERGKVIAVITLAVLLVVALGVIAFQAFYPQHVGPEKDTSFAKSSVSKSSQVSSSKNLSTNTSSSTVVKTLTWETLSDQQKDAVYVQWINNAQGNFDLYTGEAYRIYMVNVGSNGISNYSDPVGVIQNTARIQINADGTYYLQVPDPSQTGLRMMQNPWAAVNWQTKETLTGEQLFSKYGAANLLTTGATQIHSIKNTLVPMN